MDTIHKASRIEESHDNTTAKRLMEHLANSPTATQAYSVRDRSTIGVLTPFEHKEKPWIRNIVSRFIESDIDFVLIDPCACFDPEGDDRLKNMSVLVNRVSDCGFGDVNLAKLTHAYLLAAEMSGVVVLNGSSAYSVGMAKLCHHALLRACSLATPKSLVVTRPDQVVCAAERLSPPLLVKPNMAGFGAGVRLFAHTDDLRAAIQSSPSTSEFSDPNSKFTNPTSEVIPLSLGPDGVALIQEYKAADGQYRVWVLGDRVQCAVHVTSPVSPAGSTGGGVNSSMNSDGHGSYSSQGQVPAGGTDFNGCVLNAQKNGSATVTAFQPNQEVCSEVLRVMQRCGASMGSVEYLVDRQTGRRLYFDVNMLSTLPDVSGGASSAGNDSSSVVGAEACWGHGYDPWAELCEFIVSASRQQKTCVDDVM